MYVLDIYTCMSDFQEFEISCLYLEMFAHSKWLEKYMKEQIINKSLRQKNNMS